MNTIPETSKEKIQQAKRNTSYITYRINIKITYFTSMGTTKNTQKQAKLELDHKLLLAKPNRQILEDLAIACAKTPSQDNVSFFFSFLSSYFGKLIFLILIFLIHDFSLVISMKTDISICILFIEVFWTVRVTVLCPDFRRFS